MEVAVQGQAAVADDAEDFRGWVAPHLVSMGRLATRLTSPADSDDVVQEALVRAWRKRSQFDETRGSAQSWLLAIVADRSRRHRTRTRPSHDLVDLTPHGSDRRDLESSLDLEHAISALPKRQRLAVELHYLIGLDVRECAAVMGCSDGTVKSTLFDARTKLRGVLEEGESR